MEVFIKFILYAHITVGITALISGAVAIISAKGQTLHRSAGRIYFIAMTMVFVTGLTVASYTNNWFLILIAFLSYYSVFCGLRILSLKKLHKTQKAKWYDWGAGVVNTIANLIFLWMGLSVFFKETGRLEGAILSIGFSVGGLMISYANLKPFFVKPTKAHHWYLSHIGNMMGGYIATSTAFLSTMVTRYDLMNPFLAFALPSIFGIPLLLYWTRKIDRSFSGSSLKNQ